MHLDPFIKDLATILGLAALVIIIFQRLRIPIVLGYLLAGFLVGPNSFTYPRMNDIANIKTWAEIGVIILMFSLGLEFNFRRLLRLGLPVVLTGVFEVLGTAYIGFLVGVLMGWSHTQCLFLGAVLSISSTTIIAKSFEELGVKSKRFAEFVFGLLIIEDLLAIIFLVLLSTPRPEQGVSPALIAETGVKIFLVVGSWFMFGYYFLPRLLRHVGKRGTDESLIIFSLGLCFLLAMIATEFQFSSSLGAFIMGSILSESTEAHRVEKHIRPLRDLFLAVFFISVGMLLDLQFLAQSISVILLLTSALILGKILLVTLGSTMTGVPIRDGVRTSFSMTQIGEFSFIIATLGIEKGSINAELLSLAVAISMITTFLTPFMITAGQKVSQKLEGKLSFRSKEFLHDYQKWWASGSSYPNDKSHYSRGLKIWILNGIVIFSIFVSAAQMLLPYLKEMDWLKDSAALVAWSAAFFLSLPFIWGMFWSFRLSTTNDVISTVLKSVSRITLLILVGTLSGAFFEAQIAVAVIILATLLALVLLYRKLETAYGEFEAKFIRTFEIKEQKPFEGFSPWDTHLSKVTIPRESPILGQTLLELDIRKQTGASIVNIRRGEKDIVAPPGGFRIFPDDEFLVLGTDDQIQKLQKLTEAEKEVISSARGDFKIFPIWVESNHPFCGKQIADLNLQKYESILIGVERERERLMSPPGDFKVQAGDYLWLVGPRDFLTRV